MRAALFKGLSLMAPSLHKPACTASSSPSSRRRTHISECEQVPMGGGRDNWSRRKNERHHERSNCCLGQSGRSHRRSLDDLHIQSNRHGRSGSSAHLSLLTDIDSASALAGLLFRADHGCCDLRACRSPRESLRRYYYPLSHQEARGAVAT